MSKSTAIRHGSPNEDVRRNGDIVMRIVGAGVFAAMAAALGYGLIARPTFVRLISASNANLEVRGAVLTTLLTAGVLASIAGGCVIVYLARRYGLTLPAIAKLAPGFGSAFFVFLAGGVLAFRPAANMFNIVDSRIVDGVAIVEIGPMSAALAVAAIAVWLWLSICVGLAIARRNRNPST